MKFSLKISAAVHILLVAHFFSESTRITGRLLTKSTGCNPVVVRTLVLSLKNAGILEVSRGPQGGARLLKPPDGITLWDIYSAVDPESMASLINGVHTGASRICPVGKRIMDVLRKPYGSIAVVMERKMRRITLMDMALDFPEEEIAAFRETLSENRRGSRPD
jgi:DNA-binding IscR family transcriptional regulator